MTGAPPELVVVRGGGDIATGVVWRLNRAGWPVLVTELASPLTVRRTVSVSSAVTDGVADVEGMRAELAADPAMASEMARRGVVAVVVCEGLPEVGADVVVDARVAKRNIDTSIDDAALVVGVGPGFTAGVDCHAVVETNRGHHLGRCAWSGSAEPNTSTPGTLGGRGGERVLRAATSGVVTWCVVIGDPVVAGQPMGSVANTEITAPFDGVVRGLITPGVRVPAGMKIGDVDSRGDRGMCWEISDKSLGIGGGVLEAVLTWMTRR